MTDTPTPEEAAKDLFFDGGALKLEAFMRVLKKQREAGRREGAERMRKEAIMCVWTGGEITNLSVDAVLADEDGDST